MLFPTEGPHSIKCPGSNIVEVEDCRLLDTNKDLKIDMQDDPFEPYYPGDDFVDWVGMSIFHFGVSGTKEQQAARGCWPQMSCWRPTRL